MSEIRRLLADAQDAERRGKKEEASRLLRIAAAWYRDRQMLKRAGQMLRQARRVEGIEEDLGDATPDADAVFGFGEEDDAPPEVAEGNEGRVLMEQRVPQLADPALEAWCSFCCRPKTEVGPLVAGPAGAYVCAGCLKTASGLLGGAAVPSERTTWEIKALTFELPAQRRARLRFTRSRSRLALVIGPEGTGKSAWLQSLGSQPELRLVEVTQPLTADDEDELLRWLGLPTSHQQPFTPGGLIETAVPVCPSGVEDRRPPRVTRDPSTPLGENGRGGVIPAVAGPSRSAFLVVRAAIPPPALVLQGEHGEEPLHDTASLVGAVPHVSSRLLARVDAVIPFEPPHPEELASLAQAIAEARGVSLPPSALAQLVSLAQRAGRGAHELATLIARIPPGKYGP